MGGADDRMANHRLTLPSGATSSINGADRVMIEASPASQKLNNFTSIARLKYHLAFTREYGV